MRPAPEMIPVLIDTAKTLKASQRRAFMAKTVKAMGSGGPLWAEAHLGWNRGTIRKAMHELDTGMTKTEPPRVWVTCTCGARIERHVQ